MPREKKKEDPPKGAPAFMTTWGDMCTLLLCFFVMLLAMSTIDPAKFHVAASSFQNAFSGVLESFPSILITRDILVPRLGGDEQNKRMAIDAARRIRRSVQRDNLDEAIKVEVTESGIAIKIADPVGFESGRADIKPELIKTLHDIAATIGRVPETQIRVEGHTDDIPISTPRFPSNWELSAARALNVVKFLAQQGGINPANLSAVGYGEYRPLVPNTSAENRRINRRIEIYVDYIEKRDRS
ncbi:Flagellar motor rotation protein MotB [Chitinispirillum alkaliphilum]|nr:Flagellar motor rotation protein MotB [Chitinispirillum alkaliphilum]